MKGLNVGEGTPEQRTTKTLWRMMHDPNVVTRWLCAEIIARKLRTKHPPQPEEPR